MLGLERIFVSLWSLDLASVAWLSLWSLDLEGGKSWFDTKIGGWRAGNHAQTDSLVSRLSHRTGRASELYKVLASVEH